MGDSNEDDRTIFVGGLSEEVTKALLYELFLQSGPIENVTIPKDKVTKKCKSFGFICFQHEETVSYAYYQMDGIQLFGRRLKIQSRNNKAISKSYKEVGIHTLDPTQMNKNEGSSNPKDNQHQHGQYMQPRNNDSKNSVRNRQYGQGQSQQMGNLKHYENHPLSGRLGAPLPLMNFGGQGMNVATASTEQMNQFKQMMGNNSSFANNYNCGNSQGRYGGGGGGRYHDNSNYNQGNNQSNRNNHSRGYEPYHNKNYDRNGRGYDRNDGGYDRNNQGYGRNKGGNDRNYGRSGNNNGGNRGGRYYGNDRQLY